MENGSYRDAQVCYIDRDAQRGRKGHPKGKGWSGAWGKDGAEIASGLAGLVRVGVKLPVQGLACAGESS